ncbi:MAG: EAL domain-containing protein [Magnetococcales bacterium]|nr:EAL domain-containing protein [Magnetococcales bacterium]
MAFRLNIRQRLLILPVLLVVIAVAVVSGIAWTALSSTTERMRDKEMRNNVSFLSDTFTTMEKNLLEANRIVSRDGKLSEAIYYYVGFGGERAPINTVLKDIFLKKRVDQLIVTDKRGLGLAYNDDLTRYNFKVPPNLLGTVLTSRKSSSEIKIVDGRIMIVSQSPIFYQDDGGSTFVGALISGHTIGESFLNQLKGSSSLHIASYYNGRVRDTTHPAMDHLTITRQTFQAMARDEFIIRHWRPNQSLNLEISFLPIRTKSGKILGTMAIGIDEDEVDAIHRKTRWLLGLTALAIGLVVGLIGWKAGQEMALAISKLVRASDQMAAGDLTTRVTLERRDELGQLGERFNAMAQRMENQHWMQSNAAELSDVVQKSKTTAEAAQKIMNTLVPLLNGGFGAFYMREGDSENYKRLGGYACDRTEGVRNAFTEGEGIIGHCVLENRTIILSELPPGYISIHSGLGQSAPQSILAAPISFQNKVLAVIEIAALFHFDARHQAFIEEVRPAIGLGLENLLRAHHTKTLLLQTQNQAEEMQEKNLQLEKEIVERARMTRKNERAYEAQYAISRLLETALDPAPIEEQMGMILDILFSVSWFSLYTKGSIFLENSTENGLVLAAHRGFSPQQVTACTAVPSGMCLCGRAYQQGVTITASEIDHRHEIALDNMEPHGHFCVPVLAREQVLGVINLYVPDGHTHSKEEEDFLSAVAQTVVGLIERRRLEEQLKLQAEFDDLTGLPNRALFQRRVKRSITRAKRQKSELVVMFIDLDRFKMINDTMGHKAGDALLQEAAKRIQLCIRDSDTVARLGGDEFTVLLPELTHICYVELVARRILEELEKPFKIQDSERSVSGSIGITIFPNDATDLDELLRNADSAMYQAKDAGRSTFRFFTPEMNEEAERRIDMEHAIRDAMEAGDQFLLHYQPKVETQTGRITGMEALIRWNRPDHGMISPFHFITIAEETGLIVPLGLWVLETACRQTKAWLEAGLPAVKVAVNISSRQFQSKTDLIETLRDVLEKTSLDPQYLELEITESMVMENVNEAIATLEQIRRMGIDIAIDDFGTGYSSLGVLKKFPIQTLKVDRAFIKDIPSDDNDVAITAAIVSMASNLGLKVVAEGAETIEQVQFLKTIGCDTIQGYYFSKPLDAAAFEAYLKAEENT